MQSYTVICKNCKASRDVQIHKTPVGFRVDWLESDENSNHPICSARHRFDGEWGWQCKCGNNDLWTEQESRVVKNKITPAPAEINAIVENLEKSIKRFEMVGV